MSSLCRDTHGEIAVKCLASLHKLFAFLDLLEAFITVSPMFLPLYKNVAQEADEYYNLRIIKYSLICYEMCSGG